ncbi:unnamed protein product [Protopolystoma xenopodis]|uniref:Uncharacterized protein n=1 Tax=Protopolystoma xenopodis TaxID=117903 RepID=A0A3S5CVY0_9PLAT|nr:unnamed protein product [Protopolystoma xenopodis]
MVLRIVKLTDDANHDADYDAGGASGNVPRPRSDFGNEYAYNGLRTRCVPLSLSTNMTKLRKQVQTTFIQRKETATTQKATPSWSSYLFYFVYVYVGQNW